MQLTLTVITGPHAGRSVSVDGPTPRTVGRGRDADLSVEDQYLSDAHFAVWCDERGGWFRDLNSYYGTYVNQQGVPEGALRDGDTVQAGQTLFSARVVAPVVAPPMAPGDDELDLETITKGVRSTPRDCARWVLQSESGNLYAVVDFAHNPELIDILNSSGEEFCAFDESREVDQLGEFAPVLVKLRPEFPALAKVVEEVWGEGPAVFLLSDAGFIEVYRHLLDYVGFDEEGALSTRQFYDPVVLEAWLSSCSLDEARSFFGPVRCFFAEADTPENAMRLSVSGNGFERALIPLRLPEIG